MQNRDKEFTFAPLYYGKVGGLLAQLVEQWIENPCVPGSIPGETTIKSVTYKFVGDFFYVFARSLHDFKKLPLNTPNEVFGRKKFSVISSLVLSCCNWNRFAN